jgi:hypothetical protein
MPLSEGASVMTGQRRRVRQTMPLKERLLRWAQKLRNDADELRPGPEKDALLKKARQADAAAHVDDWANSSGSPPPK